MSSATPKGPAGEAVELPAGAYSKDYWDLVIEQLAKRKLFKIGLSVLALMYGVAIYAPFLANDRPFVFEGIDVRAYVAANNSLRSVASGVERRMKQTESEYLSELEGSGTLGQDGVPQDLAGALIEERFALETRMDVLRLYLPAPEGDGADGPRALLLAFESQVDEAIVLFDGGQAEQALELISTAKKATRELKKNLKPINLEQPDAGGVALVGKRSYPLWDALAPGDVFFMVLWVFVLLWPLWNPLVNLLVLWRSRDRIRRWRRRKVLIVLLCSVVGSFAYAQRWGPGENMNVNAPYKAGLTEGTMLRVAAGEGLGSGDEGQLIWTPLRYGVAESHREEMFRPPTWAASSEIDEQGAYVSREVSAEEIAAAGAQEVLTPILVREAEPERNDWNRHLSGTDNQGRDFITRLIWGARTSLTVGILSAFLLTVIGVVFGALAGYFGGWVDIAIMRLIEILQSIPAFFLILMTMAFIPQDVVKPIFAIVIVIALVRWTGTARLVRGEFLRLRDAEFVVAARALGFSNRRTIFRHVLPNAMSPVLVSAAFAVAAGILTESAISFLGFGILPPEASWGSLVNESRDPSHWWIQIFPGVLIFITVTCYNLVGDAVRDAMDPKMKV
ncbi:MAG: peptide/nickel transport system permease protein [Planctomycetota bacterium]|jgi:peptide/nickel transport system permease protein